MDLKKITSQVCRLTQEVGTFLNERVHQLNESMIEEKGTMDFVTEVDKESEKLLVTGLSKIQPEAGFIAEEGTSAKKGARFNWVIDPIDGTTNFIHGVFPFCISIALIDSDDLVLGVIHDPIQNECFSAWKNGGAYLNGDPIQVTQTDVLRKSLVATGFPYTDFSRIDEYMDSLREFMGVTHGVRRLGSAAIDLAYVACGRYDAFYEYHLKPWDVAAGTVLIREAGGQVCDFNGGNDYLFGETYVGTNGNNHAEFMEVIQKHFK